MIAFIELRGKGPHSFLSDDDDDDDDDVVFIAKELKSNQRLFECLLRGVH